ncbi:cysteinyl leukotriene receptor 2-like [Ambystoma mexicanum]|uniref:cysteinyl leukotriene receptor 2-like n=1 Tax=Ambystoma mexicanum TaxID=8296 RepID=UPI0037E8C44B
MDSMVTAPWTESLGLKGRSTPNTSSWLVNITDDGAGGVATVLCIAGAEFQYRLLPAIYGIVCILSLAGNLAAAYSCFTQRARAPPVNVFLYNLILIDLLFSLSLPLQLDYHRRQNNWIFGEALCKTTSALFFANMYGCTLFLACVCIDRYLAVLHPVRYLQLKKPAYRVVLSLVIWAVIGAAVTALSLSGSLTNTFPDGRTACMENFSTKSWSKRLAAMTFFSSAVGFFVPFITILTCYFLIFRRIVDLADSTGGARTLKRRSLRTILIVIGVLTLCFLPFHSIQTVHTFGRVGISPGVLRFTCGARRAGMALASLNSFLDPLVYYFNSENVQCRPSCLSRVPTSGGSRSTQSMQLQQSSGAQK